MITEGTTATTEPASDFPVELLARLVSLAAGSDDVAEIQAVNDLVAAHCTMLGFCVERVPVAGRGDLLVAEMPNGRAGSPIGRRISIVGHSDTVWPVGSVSDPRLCIVEGGSRWAGPGIGDMKAALLLAASAASTAARALADAPAGLVRIVVVPDEEVGSTGSSDELARLVDETDLCIGLEAGKPDGSFITSRGAVGAVRIEVRGRAAHVTDAGGVNAVDGLLDVLARIRSTAIDGALVSITCLDGGTARQIAAAEASAWIDLRADTATGMRAAVTAIEGAVADVARSTGAMIEMTGGQTRPAFPRAAADLPWALLSGIEPAGSDAATAVHERGGSDASTFASAGVPTIDGFGPVCFDNCAPSESISIDSISSRTASMAELIIRWSLS